MSWPSPPFRVSTLPSPARRRGHWRRCCRGDEVGEAVAGAVEVGGAGEGEVLEVGAEGEGKTRFDGIDPAGIGDGIAGIVDHIGVVAQTADGRRPQAAVEEVGESIAGEGVGPAHCR